MDSLSLHNREIAGCVRRLLAAIYDWLLVIAVMMVLSTPLVALLDDAIRPGNNLYRAALLLVAFAFFTGFWSRGGQTLGMRAWRLQLQRRDGSAVTFRHAALRFLYAAVALLPAGLGFLWIVWDKDRLSWHDRWSDTTIALLPKRTKHNGR